MLRRKLIAVLIVGIMAVSVFAGCAGENTGELLNPINTTSKTTMLDEAEIAYEKEEMLPSIQVDLVGYQSESKKLAILEGSVIPQTFKVVDNSSGRVVYVGQTEKIKEYEDEGIVSARGDFSSITSEGSYHIEAELLGRSKDFEVKDNLYGKLMSECFLAFDGLRCPVLNSEYVSLEANPEEKLEVSGGFKTDEYGGRDVADGCLAIFDLLKAYDYYANSFGDDAGISESGNKIPDLLDEVIFELNWLMKMQNPETGGVYTSVTAKTLEDGSRGEMVVVGETTRATAYYCAAMAKASYSVKKYDEKLSKECLNRADQAWTCLEANKDIVASSQMFRAAVEMYRSTGFAKYKSAIEDYLKVNADKPFEDRLTEDAAMSYMSTSKEVDMNYCTLLMQNFMDETEGIAGRSKDARYLVDEDAEDTASLLRNLSLLVEADYILTSKEYENIEVNYLHYLCGRNPKAKRCDELTYNPDAYAQFLILVAKLSGKK